MHEITENVVLEMTNVLSFRGKVTQQQLNEISKEIETLIKSNNAHKKGGSVSATYAVDTTGTIPLIDMELLIPLDKDFPVNEPYRFKPVFKLKNAIKIRHEGSPVYLQNTANELMRYISEHGYTPATAGYNVTVKEPANQADINNMIVDIYIGVNDNIL
ncbi:AraC family transcriptional regulator [Ruminococcus flavefaciens]|uniref:Effector-binding domain-containing protein n=1 Tax=Ruminococcus flavefaciens TaxID=1265 RepID=A0A315XW56_RUMFL|nr:AraC family transcriptional regulator [Ruminococcus flavefaciens]PWJ09666.1 effector-binding domain-containing protein [Ruminococcus flavefaciens]SSA52284.1 effector-binding domain-containing protein [Ruminococcus flavefaciens]